MDTIFVNSENSRTFEYHVLVLKLADKLDLRRGQKSVTLSNLIIYYTWRKVKNFYGNNYGNLHSLGLKNLNYQMDHT